MPADGRTQLPSRGFPDTLADTPRAGSVAEQSAWHARGSAMLEAYRTPSGAPGVRLSNDWMGQHGVGVQVVAHALLGDVRCVHLLEPMAEALRTAGCRDLIGMDVTPDAFQPSAVWRVPADADHISRFFEAHRLGFHLLFAPQAPFAICANEGDFAAVAAPAAMLRRTLPPEERGAAATRALKEDLEDEHGEGFLDGILAHYAPFALAD